MTLGYVYKYTHKENGMWYIGSHKHNGKKYTGSGIHWGHARDKYGLEAFFFEILYEGEEFRAREEEILKELDAAGDPMSYNAKNEAMGGSFPGEKNGMFGVRYTKEERFKRGNAFRGKKRPEHAILISGEKNPNFHHGKRTKEYSIKIQQKRKELNTIGKNNFMVERKCPYCCLIGKGSSMTLYHFDKCYLNPERDGTKCGNFSEYPRPTKGTSKKFMCPNCKYIGKNLGNMNRWHFNNCKSKIMEVALDDA
jgi:hypothetical protein